MSDFKTEVERVEKQFKDADVRKRNTVVGIAVAVLIVLVIVAIL